MYLRGYEIMGVNKKMERILALKLAKDRYKDFCREFKEHQKAIAEYFMLGIEAKAFSDGNGRILTEKDDLWTFFADNKYSYTLRRQRNVTHDDKRISIFNQILQNEGK